MIVVYVSKYVEKKSMCLHNISAPPTVLHTKKSTENKSVLWFTQCLDAPYCNRALGAYDIG